MGHHTKDRGDQGVAYVTADLMAHDIVVARPLSEHTPFDLVVLSPDFKQGCRLSVKYRTLTPQGTIALQLKSVWSDRHGTHTIVHDKTSYDAIAVYCPETHECYYVRTEEIVGVTLVLRVRPPDNSQQARIRMASEFRQPLRLFGLATSFGFEGPIGVTAALHRPPDSPATHPSASARDPPVVARAPPEGA